MDNGILGYILDTICPLLPHKHALSQSLGKYIARVRVLWTVHSFTDLYEPGKTACPGSQPYLQPPRRNREDSFQFYRRTSFPNLGIGTFRTLCPVIPQSNHPVPLTSA